MNSAADMYIIITSPAMYSLVMRKPSKV